MKLNRFTGGLLCAAATAVVLSAGIVAQQAPSNAADPVTRAEELTGQALEAMEKFMAAGGKNGDPDHPGREWAAKLWAFREKYIGSEAAAIVTGEAVHQLVHAGAIEEAWQRAASLPAKDPAWERVIRVLYEGAELYDGYAAFARQASKLLEKQFPDELAAELHHTTGMAYQKLEQWDSAASEFRAASRLAKPGSRLARQVEALLIEVEKLRPGLRAPGFTAHTMDGAEISLAEYRGRPVLLVFWASWCAQCVAEAPRLLKLYEQYSADGLTVVGISIDDDREALARMVARKGLPWPQVFDGQGYEGAVPRLYNIRSIPTHYVIDREGRIAASRVEIDGLEAAIRKVIGP